MKPAFHLKALLSLLLVTSSFISFSQTTIVASNASWSYLVQNSRPTNWPTSHNATAWSTGAAPIGYGNTVTTTVGYGGDVNNRYITTYFDKIVNIPSAAAYGTFTINLIRDDGAVIYINGREAVRSNMPKAAVAHSTLASTNVGGAAETQVYSYTIGSSYFVDGNNTISLELHQDAINSSDISFSMELIGNPTSLHTTYIMYNENWKLLDNGTNQGTGWRASGFADATWSAGHGDFGYSDDGGQVTPISYGSDANNKYVTTYFRKAINIPNPAAFSSFLLNIKRDDGVVVYINGTERYLNNITTNPGHTTLATSASDNGETAQSATLLTSYFTAGINVIAVEIHQTNVTTSDMAFDMELIGQVAVTPPTTLMAFGGSWRYLDNDTRPANWETTGFTPTGWGTGNAELGYGDAPATTVSFGPSSTNKYITTYFRRNLNITGLSGYSHLTFNIVRDDGFVMYVNGVEVKRDNMPLGAIAHSTLANATVSGTDETTPISFTVCPSYFVEGNNMIAVEMHQDDPGSSDISFNLEVLGNILSTSNPSITRQPYLQMGRQNAITIRWRTDIACFGRVQVGTSHGSYTTATVSETCPTTEHEITVTGLTADTKYFYTIGTTTPFVSQALATNFFRTLPLANTTRKLRFAVFGDCGRNQDNNQAGSLAAYQSYLSTNGIDAADAMLLLGDNAYNDGTDAQYTTSFFGAYGNNILKNHKLYPVPGNHDYYSSSTTSRTNSYYTNFTMPANAEIGGVASGTEAYYSYNIGDVHFLALDSYGEEAGATKLYDTLGAQVTWIKADLAANTKKWVVAYWHHPPYTKGSHDSDTETDLIAIRENFIRILERNGVDMILCGHSHDYERSYLLKGFYKSTPAGSPVNGVNFNVATHTPNSGSSGTYDGTANSCVYTTTSGKNHHGTVYVLSGSSGAAGGLVTTGSDPWPHNGLAFSRDEGGMFYFEIDNNRLDAKFIREDGAISDRFTIMKDVNVTTNLNVMINNPVALSASWPSDANNYNWSTGANTREINVTPVSIGTTFYTVTDNRNCITDQFSITATGTLPVSLLTYNVRLNNGKVDIDWSTATEINNSHFTIERSANGTDFNSIARITGAGNSTDIRRYAHVDPSPLLGTSFYRLSQTDFDGKTEYMGIKRIVNNSGKEFEARVLASNNNTLSLQIISVNQASLQLRIYDMLGREYHNEKLNVTSGMTRKEITLGTGIYIWEIRSNKGEVAKQKIVIQ